MSLGGGWRGEEGGSEALLGASAVILRFWVLEWCAEGGGVGSSGGGTGGEVQKKLTLSLSLITGRGRCGVRVS